MDGPVLRRIGEDEIAVPLAEGVIHLVEHRRKTAVRPIAIVDAEWVEDMAEQSWHAKELNGPPFDLQPRRGQGFLDISAKGPRAAIAVITVMVAEDIEAVV